jgi:hypothetical protein
MKKSKDRQQGPCSQKISRIREVIRSSENQEQLLDALSPVQRAVAEQALKAEE